MGLYVTILCLEKNLKGEAGLRAPGVAEMVRMWGDLTMTMEPAVGLWTTEPALGNLRVMLMGFVLDATLNSSASLSVLMLALAMGDGDDDDDDDDDEEEDVDVPDAGSEDARDPLLRRNNLFLMPLMWFYLIT